MSSILLLAVARRAYRAVSLALLASLCTNCGSGGDAPSSPAGGVSLRVGVLTSGALQTAGKREYRFESPDDFNVSVYLVVDEGTASLHVRDASGAVRDSIPEAVAPSSFGEYRAGPILTPRGARFTIEVRAAGPARFRLSVEQETTSPERRDMRFAVGDTVAGEDLTWWDDEDRFVFHADSGEEMVVTAQFLSPIIQGKFIARIAPWWTWELGPNLSGALDDRVFGMFGPAVSGQKSIVISVDPFFRPNFGWPVPYRFSVYRRDRAPEHSPRLLSLGDTLESEGIERPHDLDEFIVQGPPHGEYNLFLQLGRTPGPGLAATAYERLIGGDVMVEAFDSAAPLQARSSGLFRAPGSGAFKLRVVSGWDGRGGYQGPYRLFLYPIDRRPETHAAVLTFGDTVAGETIEYPGDVDEYILTIPRPTLANFFLSHDGDYNLRPVMLTSERLPFAGADSGSGPEVISVGVLDAPGSGFVWRNPSGMAVWPAGIYRFAVTGTSGSGSYSGRYELVAHAIDSLPEFSAPTLTYGVTVSTERADARGDIDVFTFNGTKGHSVTVRLDFPQPRVDPPFGAALVDGSTGIALAGASTPVNGGYETGRVTLPASGTYRIVVQTGGEGFSPSDEGRYRLTLTRVP